MVAGRAKANGSVPDSAQKYTPRASTSTGSPSHAPRTAARVCAAAHGGRIVTSAELKTALGSLPDGLRFRRLGRHPVAGLPAAVALYQGVADGLPAKFPPLRIARKR